MSVGDYDFSPGSEFSGVVIVRRSSEHDGFYASYDVRCLTCDRIFELSRANPLKRVYQKSKSCRGCSSKISAATRAKPGHFVQRDCPICDDCQALRPADGTPCVCGGVRNEVRAA